MKPIYNLVLMLCVLGVRGVFPAHGQHTHLICGADLSYLPQIEAADGVFYDQTGAPIDPIVDFAARGGDMVRLRLWHTPDDGINDLATTLKMARRVQEAGMTVMLNIHYSDTWSDPAHQTKPAAWADLSFEALTRAVHDYTVEVVSAFTEQGTPPAIVQVGNEISSGLLWEDGRVRDETGWPNLIALLQAASDGVRSAAPDAQVMIHLDAGGDPAVTRWFFDHLGDSVDFDLIGLSFYPWWHGELTDLAAHLNLLAERYGKPMMVVETAYPWTLGWADDTHNLVGLSGQLHAGFPATPAGQVAYLQALIAIIAATPDGLGLGLMYWEPAAISPPSDGSALENLALFDFDGRSLAGWLTLAGCGE